MLHIVAESWFGRHDEALGVAVLSIALSLALAVVVDRTLRRAQTARLVSARLDASADTRLRFLRRVIEAAIVTFGVGVALSQFTALDKLGASVLASGAIAAAVIGFAARQTLANAIAGILLAVTQPLRLDDLVTFEGETGIVDDVRLSYTFLRTADGTRIVIPNERLAAGVLRNDTVLGRVRPNVEVWIHRDVEVEGAIAAVEAAVPQASVTVTESAIEGTRLAVGAPAVPPGTRADREAEMRRAALRAIAALGRPATDRPT